MKDDILRLLNVSKHYGEGSGTISALKNVTLNLKRGEMVCVLGESGSGKSTLLNLIGGIDKPSNGDIIFNNQNINNLSNKELTLYRRNEIGFIFQFFNLLDELNVYQNVTVIPGSNKNKSEVISLLKKLGIENKINKFTKELSGGEQQRVCIARALNKNSSMLLCDEPTGALDYKNGKDILNLIETIHSKTNKTIIIVTHTKEISYICDRIITMKSGEIIKDEKNKHIKKSKEVNW